jgi:Carboxypeptidase regulatory-like domain
MAELWTVPENTELRDIGEASFGMPPPSTSMQLHSVISGIVRGPDGQPVPQARVYFTRGPVPLPDIAALTDSAGKFSLSVPSVGTYTIECTAEGFAPTTEMVTVTDSEEIQLEIQLRP